MPIAVFQKKIFQVSSNKKYTFIGLSYGDEIQTEQQDKIKSKPSTYVKGAGLAKLSFSIPLNVELGINVRKEIDEWESILLAAQPSIFMLGNKPLGQNKWLLKSRSVSDEVIDNVGNMLKATLKLDFEEFVREGKAVAVGTSSSPAAIGGKIIPNQDIFNPPTKVAQKRDNLSYKAAIAKMERLSKSV
jgi:hypothetical protein